MSLLGLLLRRAGAGSREAAAVREARPDPVAREGRRAPAVDAWRSPVVDAPAREKETEPIP